MIPKDEESLALHARIEELSRRLDIKEIRDEAESQALRTLIKTEVSSMQKDVGAMIASTNELKSSVVQSMENFDEELRENYVSINRFSPLEKIFWAVILAVLLGLIGGALTMLTSRGVG